MQERGLAVGECPDEWSISHPDTVTEIAVSYLAAGADMVETNSFGANRFKLGQFGLADKAAEINEAAARASRNALRGALDKFVIASVGPTGKMLVAEEVTESGLYDAFSEQVVALERGGADAVCIETMTDVMEAAIAIKATRENTSLEIIATFTFDRTVQGTYRTMMGVSPERAAAAALEAGADITGANCGNGMEQMTHIIEEMKAAFPNAFLLVHANAGLPENLDSRDVFPETPNVMASHVHKLLDAGVSIIGGCCGTTPAHIKAIKAAVDSYIRTQ